MWLFMLACSGAPEPLGADLSPQGVRAQGLSLEALGEGASQGQLALLPGILRIDGSLESACPGQVRVDVLERRDATGPLTTLKLWPGALRFQVLAPAGEHLSVTAICDANADGVLDTEHDQVSELVELGALGAGAAVTVRLAWE